MVFNGTFNNILWQSQLLYIYNVDNDLLRSQLYHTYRIEISF